LFAASAKATVALALLGIFISLGGIAVTRAIGYLPLIIRTGSMTGTAPVGSLVLARPIDTADVKRGDVILLQRSTSGTVLPPVLHRVIQRYEESGDVVVRTQGDANAHPDPDPYTLRGSTWTPVLIVPRLGFALSTLSTPIGWFVLIVAPALALSVLFLYRLWFGGDRPRQSEVGLVPAAG
jgi:signal peptidase